MTMRYWKKLSSSAPDGVSALFRKNMGTGAVERYAGKGSWVNAFDRWESIVMEPDYVEIDEKEAKTLMTEFE